MNNLDDLFTLLGPSFLARLVPDDIGPILDSRDQAPFDVEWVRLNNAVTGLATVSPLPVALRAEVDRLRELAFKQAFTLTGSPDVAAYVSDDLGLLAETRCHGLSDPFLDSLWRLYSEGFLPGGSTVA